MIAGIGPREMVQAADGAVAPVAGRLDRGGVAGAPAVALDAVPSDQRDRVGGEGRFGRLELVRKPRSGTKRRISPVAGAPAVAS